MPNTQHLLLLQLPSQLPYYHCFVGPEFYVASYTCLEFYFFNSTLNNFSCCTLPMHVSTQCMQAINTQTGKNYEQEFEFETARMAAPKIRSTPWGSSYR